MQPFAELARGPATVVYKAYDAERGAVVLLKTLQATADAAQRARFAEEARLAAGVVHPNVVRVLGADPERGALVAEWVEGSDLGALLKRAGPLPPALAAYLGRETARGLAAVHAAGILHRDVSVGNVLVSDDGAVKLTDFGLASLGASPDGEVRGTLGTLAPELVRGGAAAPRSDLFSLGAVLAFALTGRPPFPSDDPAALLDALVHHDPADALRSDPRVPAPLAEAVAGLLAKDPEDRPASADAVARQFDGLSAGTGREDLAAFLHDPSAYEAPVWALPADPASQAEPASERPPRHPAAPSRASGTSHRLAVALVLFGAVLGAVALWPRPDPPAPPAQTDAPQRQPLGLDDPAPDPLSEPAPSDPPEVLPEEPRAALDPERTEQADPQEPAPPSSEPAPGPPEASPEEPLDPPAEQPVATGRLALQVQPWAHVRVGERDLGTTPLAPLVLPVGEHVLTLTNPEFPTQTVRVQVPAGSAVPLSVSLWSFVGRVDLRVSPWARVTVDGRSWGTVPPQDRPLVLAPGDHVLAFEHPTLGQEEVRLRIAAGERRTVRVQLTASD